jgi:diaminopropionate ammonia-lyase
MVVLEAHPLLVTENPARRRRERALAAVARRWLAPNDVACAADTIRAWPGYVAQPPFELPGLARLANVSTILYQHEGDRFGLQSFKGWGGGYATAALLSRRHSDETPVTVTCATDGNHGLAVAWAARTFGARAVVFVADIVTPARADRIRDRGARVVRSRGNHEVASAECLAAARRNGWHVITETENATDPQIAIDTLAGYGALWEETLASCDPAPTHLFVQAGVGGLAATAAAITRRRYGDKRPVLTVVEARTADCIRESLEAGRRVTLEGEFDTGLAGLAAGATSTFAWELLSAGADFAVAIRDGAAEDAMRRLADPETGDPAIEAGSSGVAGLAGALAVCADRELRARFDIDSGSRILVIGTEGATDREGYAGIVGRPPAPRA